MSVPMFAEWVKELPICLSGYLAVRHGHGHPALADGGGDEGDHEQEQQRLHQRNRIQVLEPCAYLTHTPLAHPQYTEESDGGTPTRTAHARSGRREHSHGPSHLPHTSPTHPLARLERRPTRLLGAALAEGRKVSSTAVSASAAVSWSMGAACERRRERTVGVVVGVRRGGEEGGGDLGIGGLRGSERGDLPPCSRGRNASPGERGRWK